MTFRSFWRAFVAGLLFQKLPPAEPPSYPFWVMHVWRDKIEASPFMNLDNATAYAGMTVKFSTSVLIVDFKNKTVSSVFDAIVLGQKVE